MNSCSIKLITYPPTFLRSPILKNVKICICLITLTYAEALLIKRKESVTKEKQFAILRYLSRIIG